MTILDFSFLLEDDDVPRDFIFRRDVDRLRERGVNIPFTSSTLGVYDSRGYGPPKAKFGRFTVYPVAGFVQWLNERAAKPGGGFGAPVAVEPVKPRRGRKARGGM